MDDSPPDSSGTASQLPGPHHRLVGPERAAVRRPDRESWLLVPRERLRQTQLPLGLLVEMGRKDAPRDHSRTTEPAVSTRGVPIPAPPISPGVGAMAGTGVALLALLGFVGGYGAREPAFAAALGSLLDLGVALTMIWVTLAGLIVAEGSLLADSVRGTGSLVWMGRGLPQVEPVAWRLGVAPSVAVLILLLAVTVFAIAAGWHELAPAVASGAGVGAVLYGIQALYPLRPGPGARLLEAVTRTRDLPTQLRWVLVERFLPIPGQLEVGGTRTMALAALALAAWAAGTGQALYGLSVAPPGGTTLAGSLWQGLASLGLGAWGLWLAATVVGLFVEASKIGKGISLEPLDPPADLKKAWTEESPLNRHVPELRAAPWSWGVARKGSLLIAHGDQSRDFYWVARGMVHVVGRTRGGDPQHLATVRGALGIGEIALLDDGGRTADVIAAEDSVVAVLKQADFEAHTEPESAERFREVVLASQALARARTLWGLPPDLRARWLGHGTPVHYQAGDTVTEEGEERQWVGLVVSGRLAVERNGRRLATLEQDSVFGEIAYLTGRPRTATIRTEEDTLVWRWDPEWLDRELVEAGVADELRELAEERARVAG